MTSRCHWAPTLINLSWYDPWPGIMGLVLWQHLKSIPVLRLYGRHLCMRKVPGSYFHLKMVSLSRMGNIPSWDLGSSLPVRVDGLTVWKTASRTALLWSKENQPASRDSFADNINGQQMNLHWPCFMVRFLVALVESFPFAYADWIDHPEGTVIC